MNILELLVWLGIPSAIAGGVVGLIFWKMKKDLDKAEKKRVEHEEARRQYEMFQVKMLTATVKLCEANAIALQNGKCNGETHAALDYLKDVKHDQREFLISQGIDHLF